MPKTVLPGSGDNPEGQPEHQSSGLTGSIVLNQHAWEGPGYLLGQVLGDRYRILDIIGEGGMGVVYLGEHVTLQRTLAVKVLHPELCRDPTIIDRFLQEARAASKIGHPSIVDIIDFGWMHRGSVYFVMEFLDGEDLASLLRRVKQVPWKRARNMTLQIARALRASHKKGVIHRDLKPANCFLTERDGEDFVKLLDFGIAKMSDPSRYDPPVVTRGGSVFGTPGYMAPEQASGEPADARTDVYATAACLYEFLTGSPPFIGNNFMQVVSRVLTQDLVAPSVRAPENVPKPVETVLLRAMAKNPEERYQTMGEFADAIEALDPDLQPQIGHGVPSGSVEDTSTPAYGRKQTVVPFRNEKGKPIPTPPPFDPGGGRPRRITEHLSDVTKSQPPSTEETQPGSASPYTVRSGDTDVARVNMYTGEVRRRSGAPTTPKDFVSKGTVRTGFDPKKRKTDLSVTAPESKRETLDADQLDPEALDRVRTGDTLVTGEHTLASLTPELGDSDTKTETKTQPGTVPEPPAAASGARAAPRRSLRDTQVAELGDQSFIPPDLQRKGNRGTERVNSSIEYSASAVAAAAAEAPSQFQSQPSQVVQIEDDWEADYQAAMGSNRAWWVFGPLIVIAVGLIAYVTLDQMRSPSTPQVAAEPATEVISAEPTDPAPVADPAAAATPAERVDPVEAGEADSAAAADGSAAEATATDKKKIHKVLSSKELQAGFKRARPRVIEECGRHPGTRVKIRATVSGDGFVISAKPARGQDSALARCVAGAVEKSATFAPFKKGSDTFPWTYHL